MTDRSSTPRRRWASLVVIAALIASGAALAAPAAAATGSISGKITGPDGKAIAGLVMVYGQDGNGAMTPRGAAVVGPGSTTYSIPADNGVYTVCVRPTGWIAEHCYGDKANPVAAKKVTVSGNAKKVDVKVKKPGSIAGRVVNHNGVPQVGVHVTAAQYQGTQPWNGGVAVTDDQGRYTITDLPAGTYSVCCRYITADPLYRDECWNNRHIASHPFPGNIKVKAGQKVKNKNAEMTPAGPPPDVPKLVKGAAATYSTTSVAWNDVPGAHSYAAVSQGGKVSPWSPRSTQLTNQLPVGHVPIF